MIWDTSHPIMRVPPFFLRKFSQVTAEPGKWVFKMKVDASSEGLYCVLGVIHSGCCMEDRMVLTYQERYSVLTTTARPHLLGCGLKTKLHSEIYLLGNSRTTSTHLEMQKYLESLCSHMCSFSSPD